MTLERKSKLEFRDVTKRHSQMLKQMLVAFKKVPALTR